MLRYGIQGSLLHNNEVGMIVDQAMNPIAVVDVDERTNHFILIPFPRSENSPILQMVLASIAQTATEIAEGGAWQ
jgi:hypothetical protein